MNKLFSLIGLLFAFAIVPLLSQEDKQNKNYFQDDVLVKDFLQDDEQFFKFDDEESDFWDWRGADVFNFFSSEKPTIEFLYGQSNLSFYKNTIAKNISSVQSGDIRIGYTNSNTVIDDKIIYKHEYNYFFLGNSSTNNMSAKQIGNDLKSEAWRFGFGWQSGYGYSFMKGAGLVLYHGNGLSWTNVDFQEKRIPLPDKKIINRFDESFRFGDFFEAGAKLQLFSPLSLNVAYEKNIVFERHLFWYWALSEIIESAATGIAGSFSRLVVRRSPVFGPIIDFLLKNGVSYGLFELRKKNMNWPIETAPPLMYETYRAGVSFAF